jgi:hypothetical protein
MMWIDGNGAGTRARTASRAGQLVSPLAEALDPLRCHLPWLSLDKEVAIEFFDPIILCDLRVRGAKLCGVAGPKSHIEQVFGREVLKLSFYSFDLLPNPRQPSLCRIVAKRLLRLPVGQYLTVPDLSDLYSAVFWAY